MSVVNGLPKGGLLFLRLSTLELAFSCDLRLRELAFSCSLRLRELAFLCLRPSNYRSHFLHFSSFYPSEGNFFHFFGVIIGSVNPRGVSLRVPQGGPPRPHRHAGALPQGYGVGRTDTLAGDV